jgi:hypothetical protein
MLISLIKQQAYAYQTVHFRFLNHDYTEPDEEDEIKNTLNSSSSSASV